MKPRPARKKLRVDAHSKPPVRGHNRWVSIGGFLVILAVAAIIRTFAALNDLWLDEIWSLRVVGQISSPLDVFTKIHFDNNHYLNSLWLYLCGFRGNWPGYRIPSLLAGVGTVILAGLIGRRRNVSAAFFAMLLMAFSYVQILYSSEARGYSAAVFFSLFSYYLLENYLEKRRWHSAVLLSISSVLGFTSHLIFLNFFCAALLWSGYRLVKSGIGVKRAFTAMLACYAAPTIFLAALYWIDIRHMVVGGGTPTSLPGIYASSLAWTLGAPSGNSMPQLASFAAIVLFGAGIWILWRDKPDSAIPFVAVILVMPILLATIYNAEDVYVRYFIIGMAFLLILSSFVLAVLYRLGSLGKAISFLLLIVYFAANGWHTLSLFKDGRGKYTEAIRFLAENTKESTVTIGGDHDFRIPLIIEFYASNAMGKKRAEYYKRESWPQSGPEWFVSHKESFEDPVPPASMGTGFTDFAGNQYELLKTFPTAPLSGFHWFVYHNRAK